jgi:hypothetical protein
VHTCNLIPRRLREEDCKFKTSLSYMVRPYLKKFPPPKNKLMKQKTTKKVRVEECDQSISVRQFEL